MSSNTVANPTPAQVIGRANECMRRLLEAGLTYEDLQKPIDDPEMRQRLVSYWRNGGNEIETVEPEPVPELPLLTGVTTLTIPALPEFDANKFFTSGVFRRKQSKVKFYDFGANFKSKFFNKVEAPTAAELKIQISKLNRSSKDSQIIAALGNDKAKIKLTLGQFAWLLEQQPEGELGSLLTNGWWNIFYIEDDEKTLWAVYAFWFAGYGWHVRADVFDSPGEWRDGRCVVSQFQDSLNPETSVS